MFRDRFGFETKLVHQFSGILAGSLIVACRLLLADSEGKAFVLAGGIQGQRIGAVADIQRLSIALSGLLRIITDIGGPGCAR